MVRKRHKQLSFEEKLIKKKPDRFGGALLKGNNPKYKRPLHSRYPVHLTLRAIKGGMRLPKLSERVKEIIERAAARRGVKIYRYANVGNHLHLVIRVTKLGQWAAFIREISGRIAALMREMGITESGERYWLHRPFTEVVRNWKQGFKQLCAYVHLNWLQAEGFINRRETKTLKDLRLIWSDG